MKIKVGRKKLPTGKGPNAAWLLIAVLALVLGYLFWFNSVHKERELIGFSQFLEQVESDNVKKVVIHDNQIKGEFKKSIPLKKEDKIQRVSSFETTIIPSDGLWTKLHHHKVSMVVYPADRQAWGFYFFFLFLFIVLFVALFFFLMRQGQMGNSGKIFNVGKSRAKFFSPNTIKIKFKDVAGVEEAKEDLQDVVDFLKNPEKFKRLGAKVPRGILLTGAPGNGKTMLAKAVAGEASCPFFSVNGSDFVEVFVGVGASRVRDLFLQARRNTPCIVFIDEIDAVGRHRGVGTGGGNDEREQTLNQLLSEMDGFTSKPGEVLILAATNRPDVLDKALLRPGRFDRKVDVPYPGLVSREQILKIHVKDIKLEKEVDLRKVARGTPRFTGADLANLINEAALVASKSEKQGVGMEDFEVARDKILVGAERKTLTRTSDEIKRTAYHEAGHTLVLVSSPKAQPLHKVTILSRGGTLGVTWYLPEGDDISRSESEMMTEIMVSLGGRLAEEIIYGLENRTTGAANDIKVATKIARDMVCLYGMSKLGPVSMMKQEDLKSEYSESTAQKIDEEVSSIIEKCYKNTKSLLTTNKESLDKLAESLVEKETLHAKDVYDLLGLEIPKRSSSALSSKKSSNEKVIKRD